MQSAQEPTDTDRNQCSGVRLRLDLIADPFVKRQSRFTGRVGRLPVEILRCAGRLVCESLDLAFGIARNTTKAFFDLAADISGSTRYSVFIHDCFPKFLKRCDLGTEPPGRQESSERNFPGGLDWTVSPARVLRGECRQKFRKETCRLALPTGDYGANEKCPSNLNK
jgi:hypothetical protein